MNSENDDTDDTNNDILWFETEAAGFIGAPPQGSTAGLPARVVQRIDAAPSLTASLRASSSDFSAVVCRSPYLECAYAAKIALGIGHLSLALR
jgi:hypothetical protein